MIILFASFHLCKRMVFFSNYHNEKNKLFIIKTTKKCLKNRT
ncbi:hypothetical protein CU002_2404 [Enterococcus faecium]|nr:hypothetical protein [Enterococcus faecium]